MTTKKFEEKTPEEVSEVFSMWLARRHARPTRATQYEYYRRLKKDPNYRALLEEHKKAVAEYYEALNKKENLWARLNRYRRVVQDGLLKEPKEVS